MFRYLISCVLLFIVFGCGISAYAADTSPTPATAPSPTSTSATSNTLTGGALNVQPVSPGDAVVNMKKMEGDIQQVGEGLAPSLSKYALVAGVIMLVVGILFRKVLKAGITMLGVSVLVYFILGDMSKTTLIIQKIVATMRSYF